MARSQRREADMAELRTMIARLRNDNAAFRDRMERAKADLQPRVERARADRQQAMAELRNDYNNDQVPSEDRALMRRIMQGETSWRAVFTGEDEHWTAVDYRDRFGREFADGVEQLVEGDDELASWLSEVQRRTDPLSRDDLS